MKTDSHVFVPYIVIILVGIVITAACSRKIVQPIARVQNVDTTMHGVTVSDPYRWLENWEDPAVRDWSNAQNAFAREYLDRLPGMDRITERLTEIESATSVSYYSLTWRDGKLFAEKRQPPLNQPLLVVMPSPDHPEREKTVVDPNLLDPSGATTIDWYVPSPDGEIVAVSLSKGGSEDGDVHFFDTGSGAQVDVVIPRVNGGTAGGSLIWLADGSGVLYTRYPYTGERPEHDMNFHQQVWFHKMGTPLSDDTYEIGRDFPRIAEIQLQIDPRTNRVVLTMQYGDSGRFLYYLRVPGEGWKQITSYEDNIAEAIIGRDGNLYLISLKDAPNGKILMTPMKNPSVQTARLVIPESGNSIVSEFSSSPKCVITASLIYVTYQTGGPSEIRLFTKTGKPVESPEITPISTINELTTMGDGHLLFSVSSYTQPSTWYVYDAKQKSTSKTGLFQKSPVDFSDTEVIREFATSKDGTKIPVNIMYRKGLKRDGNNPVLLYGYGGYGINRTPRFRPENRIWIEQGCIYAVANIRGGGEYGKTWHEQGRLTKKQNCFDDFAAAMQYMIDAGFTKRELLAINGGSNGGLLMGAMITQHPELFRATVSTVGVYDMIRSELTPNGTFNIPEYGTTKDPEQFKALFAYSPYHNVKDGTAYPSVLFMTGANDPRVDPMHSRKMTARLQAATTSGNPILLRTSSSTGHGGGTPLSAKIEEDVHKFAFLFHELGLEYK